MDDRQGYILENRNIVSNYFLLRIRFDHPMERPRPGQFVMVKVPDGDTFLRRPFSIYDCDGDTLSIMYRVVGKGTQTLSEAREGEKTMVLGPLGNGFTVSQRDAHIIVTGGIGVAGIHLLAKELGQDGRLFYGCSGREELAVIDDLKGMNPAIATLDGSQGFQGDVVELLGSHMASLKGKNVEVFTCGPDGMVRSLKKLLSATGTPCQVLMEEQMACGFGLCFGCVVKTIDEKEPYKRVCKEGPVFDLWQISL